MVIDVKKSNVSSIEKDCTGCRVCEIVCPRKCIHMEQNEEGFFYPVISKNECVSCGICLENCAQLKKRTAQGAPKAVFAIKNKNKFDLRSSASGGAADVAAKIVLSRGGIVFGAAYDEEMIVHHIAIEDDYERWKLRSSKYVQSDLGDCFIKAKDELNSKRKVLFTGTPCQIDSLHVYLGIEYGNLYTIDLACHGVPSPMMFKKYIDYMGKVLGEKVLFYDFRSKEKKGWGCQYLTKTKTKTKTKLMTLDPYGYHFLQGDCYRECCYVCQYANLNRPGDLTVADFWGVEKFYPKFFSPDGVSLVFVNSDKGVLLFDEMKSNMEFIPIKIEEAICKNGNLRHPSSRPERRNTIYSNIQDNDYIENLEVGFQWKARLKNLIPRKLINYLKKYI